MWKKCRACFLKLNAILAVILFLYPCIMIIRSIFFLTVVEIRDFLPVMTALTIGWGMAFLLCRRKHTLFRFLSVYAAVVMPVAAIVHIYLNQGLGRVVYEVLVSVVFYCIGIYGYVNRYDKIFNNLMLNAGIILLFAVMLITCIIEKFMYLKGMFTLIAILYLILSLVLKTQENLDFIFSNRGVELLEVQRKIRASNTKAVLMFFSAVILLLNSVKIVVFILEAIKLAGSKLLDFILYILKLLLRHKGGGTYEEGFGFMPFDPQPAWKPLAVLIFAVVLHFVVLYLLYKLAPVIYKGVRRLISYIKSVLWKLFIDKYRPLDIDNSEYTETVEQVRLMKAKQAKQKEFDLFKVLKSTSDPMARVRLMYGILLYKLHSKGIPLHNADTAGQVYEKSCKIDGIKDSLVILTDAYNDVRYGELAPGETALLKSEAEFKNVLGTLSSNQSFKVKGFRNSKLSFN